MLPFRSRPRTGSLASTLLFNTTLEVLEKTINMKKEVTGLREIFLRHIPDLNVLGER